MHWVNSLVAASAVLHLACRPLIGCCFLILLLALNSPQRPMWYSQHSLQAPACCTLLELPSFQRLSWNHKIVLFSALLEVSVADLHGLSSVWQSLLSGGGTRNDWSLSSTISSPQLTLPLSQK